MRIDEFHKHEVLHTSYVLADTWYSQIVEHVYTETDQELSKLAQEAFDAMYKVYNYVGSRD